MQQAPICEKASTKPKMYDPSRYQKYKHLHRKASQKYLAKKRTEMIEQGLLTPRVPLTPEERAHRIKERKQRELAKAKEKYATDPAWRQKIIERQRAKRASDPDYQSKANAYLREWRNKKRLLGTLKR